MTNKYEDFAESFSYFVLHNSAFLEKAKKSENLQKKYDFFRQYMFKDHEFLGENFSQTDSIEDYYWDITKIKIDYKNFLQYLKK